MATNEGSLNIFRDGRSWPMTMNPRPRFETTVIERQFAMFDSGRLADVIFVVGSDDRATTEVRAHRFILAARSAVFDAMFSDFFNHAETCSACRRESVPKIRISDCEAENFTEFLRFVLDARM